MRESKITRTIQTTKAQVMCLNIHDGTTTTQEFILPRTYKDDKAILKALASKNTDTMKLVHVASTEVISQLYAMSESKFMEMAEPVIKPKEVAIWADTHCGTDSVSGMEV